MILRFKKSHPRPVLTVVRADTSSTWMKLYPGMAMHDLAHYVIETELELKDAFYGILNKGYSIQDFEAPRDQRPAELWPRNLPAEALQAEHLINLLITELQSGEEQNVLQMLADILYDARLPPMEVLTPANLRVIRSRLLAIQKQWEDIEIDEELVLEMKF